MGGAKASSIFCACAEKLFCYSFKTGLFLAGFLGLYMQKQKLVIIQGIGHGRIRGGMGL